MFFHCHKILPLLWGEGLRVRGEFTRVQTPLTPTLSPKEREEKKR
jgi:hypothetical protein